MSEQKPSHEVKGIVRRAPRQDCVEAQIWGRVPNNSAALKVPKNTVASIILKRKKFRTTKTLPRAGRPFQQQGLGAGTGRLVRIEEKMNGAKYRKILDENLLRTSYWG